LGAEAPSSAQASAPYEPWISAKALTTNIVLLGGTERTDRNTLRKHGEGGMEVRG